MDNSSLFFLSHCKAVLERSEFLDVLLLVFLGIKSLLIPNWFSSMVIPYANEKKNYS